MERKGKLKKTILKNLKVKKYERLKNREIRPRGFRHVNIFRRVNLDIIEVTNLRETRGRQRWKEKTTDTDVD